MAEINPYAAGPFPAEWPTTAASLIVTVRPAQLAEKTLPGQTRHLITTLGIVASVWSGIAGLVVTLRASSVPVALAFAELALALAAAVLIAICGLIAPGPRRE
jgi:hypothetical protein